MSVQAEVLIEGPAANASALALTAAISFWGGVDPKSGVIADPRHPRWQEMRELYDRQMVTDDEDFY